MGFREIALEVGLPLYKSEEIMPAGRPSEYTQDMADIICAQLADGESLRTVCLAEDMPSKTSVFRWLRTHDEFRDQYARAKEESADALTDEMLDIADDGSNDWMKRHGKDDEDYWVTNGECIQRSRVRIDTRKWIASKLKPKKYGDKLTHGGDPDNPIEMNWTIEVVNAD